MKKRICVSLLICFMCSVFIAIAAAQKQKFVSIEAHMGYGNAEYFYFGGKIYNYDGENGTRNPYYRQPDLIATFCSESQKFKPDSEGYFWIKMPLKGNCPLNYGKTHLNQVQICIDKEQKSKKNRKLVLVTNYGLNIESIAIPFIEPSSKAQYLIISDFDNSITKVRGLGILEFITTNPNIINIREGIPAIYNTICGKNNPIFYVTGRPIGTYRVVEKLINKSNLPLGPILARNLGFWFINKGFSTTEHKIKSISSIINTYPDKKVVLIGDNKKNDLEIYTKIYKKYGDKILQIFIFNVKRKEKQDEGIIDYVKSPTEILEKLKIIGIIEDNNKQ